ncbi:MAG: type 2 isopentenyl-diphosphate Delta-isomerase [Ignavibacteriaceae bacterium]
MSENPGSISNRKKEHIELSLTDKVSFKEKTNGFESYEFDHYAITEVDISKINFKKNFFGKEINYPYLISCMTGGTSEAENINAQLAVAAEQLNIPLGVGSQRQALENKEHHNSYKIVRQNAPKIPLLGNIGAAQIAKLKDFKSIQFLVDLIEADAMVIHINPAQELLQPDGETNFKGLLKNIEKIVKVLNVPLIVKEVGAGISLKAAKKLLNVGVKGIDVAGAGGTSWTAVEILRSKNQTNDFWDWGLPTCYCIKEVSKLKNKFKFTLIGSGGINNPFDAAKAFALGSDITASARIVLQELDKSGVEGVINLINSWFETIKKIMFLTGSQDLKEFQKNKLILKKDLY